MNEQEFFAKALLALTPGIIASYGHEEGHEEIVTDAVSIALLLTRHWQNAREVIQNN